MAKKKSNEATPALVVLQMAGAHVVVHTYQHDPRSQSYGNEAAEQLGLDSNRVFKTLIVDADGSLAVGIVPVAGLLDLKAIAAALGAKKATMADQQAAQRSTGYVVGGISPFGQKRKLPTVLDSAALKFETVFVSGGRRGLDLEVKPVDLVQLTDAVVAKIKR
ncbi:MAG TPA: Cys-tRNA(Pro) deacylase [Aeromicrobium sp.]|nr:Cys-tRNA(Pro) deacylase [Aeromicrobium sp.]